jgi:hypothetical protein
MINNRARSDDTTTGRAQRVAAGIGRANCSQAQSLDARKMLPYLLAAIAATLALAVAVYVQLRLPLFTAGAAKLAAARAILFAVGVGCGYVGAQMYRQPGAAAVLAFIIGFGVVHLPAAAILFLKGQRGEGRS